MFNSLSEKLESAFKNLKIIKMKLLFTLLVFTYSTFSFAQTVDLSKQFKNLKPRAIGPSGMSGRITTIDALHNDPNTIYLGSASFGFGLAEVGYLKPFSSIRQYFLLKPLSAGHCNVRINSFCML